MDIKEYVIKQLARTKTKKYELYVVTRIVHLINDSEIKFVTQQYVSRPEGRALTDLYFPQFGVHIEVDEGHHFNPINDQEDRVREADIVNATNHTIHRVDATKSLEHINKAIDDVVSLIKSMKNNTGFIPWNLEAEFDPETYIKRGRITASDNVAFKTIKDACNCFGHSFKGYQRAGASHPDSDTMLWFPKLFENGEWNNQITDDEETIIERNMDTHKASVHVISHLNDKEKHKHKRIVFAKVRDNLGSVLYRFRGLYKLDTVESNEDVGLIWRRIGTEVKTYQSKTNHKDDQTAIPNREDLQKFLTEAASSSGNNRVSNIYKAIYSHKLILNDYVWTEYSKIDLIAIDMRSSPINAVKEKTTLLTSLSYEECFQLITVVIRGDRFNEGLWDTFILDGSLDLWLERISYFSENTN